MAIIYDDGIAVVTGRPFRPDSYDATRQALTHYQNYLLLKFFYQKGTPVEKMQAAKELVICERKITYWRKQDNFNFSLYDVEVAKATKLWGL